MQEHNEVIVLKKKKGYTEPFKPEKIHKAIRKSAERVLQTLSDEDCKKVSDKVLELILNKEIDVKTLHNVVEVALDIAGYPKVAESYRQYRNYKMDAQKIMEAVDAKTLELAYRTDRSNANANSLLVSTQRSILFGEEQKERYKQLVLNPVELEAVEKGYVYPHDAKDRLSTFNCDLGNYGRILKNGFTLENLDYNEPKSLAAAMAVMGALISAASGQQYGGMTVPQIDEILIPYAEKSYQYYMDSYKEQVEDVHGIYDAVKAETWAVGRVKRECEQQYQAMEHDMNSIASSRGDFAFITFTFGHSNNRWAKLISNVILDVRRGGQGKENGKVPVLFPKLVFLYDSELHGPGAPMEDLFDNAVETAKQCMYPDFLSLDAGYVGEMYHKWGKIISPMGCVSGENVVTYKILGHLFVESFERMWKRIADMKYDQGQNSDGDVNRVIDLNGLNVQIWDTKLNSFTKVKYLIRNRQSNWCTVKLAEPRANSFSRYIKVTTDHPFEVEGKGIVYAADLSQGDVIHIGTKQYSEETVNISTEEAWLLGFMLCDGCYQDHNVVASIAAHGEDDIEQALISAFRNVFGAMVITKLQERGVKGTYKDLRVIADGNMIPKCETYFGRKYAGINKSNRHIPNEVFSYNREAKLAFLAGMIDADGYLSTRKQKKASYQLGSVNKELALQQLALIQSLGMKASVIFNKFSSHSENTRYQNYFKAIPELLDYIVCEKKKTNRECYDYSKCGDDYYTKVSEIKILEAEEDYSYDVTTESEHFEVSGIYSHNCRAYLSPEFKNSGWVTPQDENDELEIYRCNLGVVSLNLPMIYKRAEVDGRPFFDVLDEYMEIARGISKKSVEFLYKKKASCDPLMFMEGGLDGGTLGPDDCIEPVLKKSTVTFGYGGLHEITMLHNGKRLSEDDTFAIQTMQHINDKIEQYKKEDHLIWAIYGTPGESWLPLACEQFVKEFGQIPGVTDNGFFTNSFHMHVEDELTPIEKIDKESKFFPLSKGGCICHVRIPSIAPEMNDGAKAIIRHAMKLGMYQSINHAQNRCTDCGNHWVGDDSLPFEENYKCPKCGSMNTIGIRRMNGYLGFSKTKQGKTKFNDGKNQEFKKRKNI